VVVLILVANSREDETFNIEASSELPVEGFQISTGR
jgi:hypothetical protein